MIEAWEEAEAIRFKDALYQEISTTLPGENLDPRAARARIGAFQRALENDRAARLAQLKQD